MLHSHLGVIRSRTQIVRLGNQEALTTGVVHRELTAVAVARTPSVRPVKAILSRGECPARLAAPGRAGSRIGRSPGVVRSGVAVMILGNQIGDVLSSDSKACHGFTSKLGIDTRVNHGGANIGGAIDRNRVDYVGGRNSKVVVVDHTSNSDVIQSVEAVGVGAEGNRGPADVPADADVVLSYIRGQVEGLLLPRLWRGCVGEGTARATIVAKRRVTTEWVRVVRVVVD